jgi:glycosyltransferase involved in cell wall biosynthesis
MMDKGQIDVVIPAFNAEKYIKKTLDSVVLQGNLVHSIIVVNDGSNDQTEQVINSFIQEHSDLNVKVIFQKNAGLANARNSGIKLSLATSKASYIALLDADDVWLEEKLAKQLKVFETNHESNLGVVYCGYELINTNGALIDNHKGIIAPSLRGHIYSSLLNGNFISGSGSSVLIKSGVFKEIGFFDEQLRASEDWDMWIRIAQKFHFDYVKDVLVQIRVHAENMQKDFSRMLSSELAMLNKFARQGTRNYFLLWKIQTILTQKGLLAQSIPGFDSSVPWVKSQLSGYPNLLWRGMLIIPTLSWPFLKKLKKIFSL